MGGRTENDKPEENCQEIGLPAGPWHIPCACPTS